MSTQINRIQKCDIGSFFVRSLYVKALYIFLQLLVYTKTKKRVSGKEQQPNGEKNSSNGVE